MLRMHACHTLKSGAEQSAGAFCGAKLSPVETLAWVLATEHPRVHGAGPDVPRPLLGICVLSSHYLRETKHCDT